MTGLLATLTDEQLAVVESSLTWLVSNFPEPIDVISVIGLLASR